MNSLYNIFVVIAFGFVKFMALFSKKLALFVNGRKNIFDKIASKISEKDKVIWIHSASLGEFEQGIPIIEKLKADKPNYKILVTFFSPSGYEVRKNYPLADIVTYLPIDSKRNVRKFLELVHPKMAVFIKYEFWPNYLAELNRLNIPTILVSGIFRESQVFFKSYGGFMRKSLQVFTHFFVQNDISEGLLQSIGYINTTVSGDTRFDRVYGILKQEKNLDFINYFTKNKLTLVAGSTWSEDEAILLNYINNAAKANEKFIIAPHNIKEENIGNFIAKCNKNCIRYSDENKDPNAQVLIVDSIGLLTKIYNYASIAYVGGGFNKSGIHNILEPATYGIPIIIGPNFSKFKEAQELVNLKACISIADNDSFTKTFNSISKNETVLKEKGKAAGDYIKNNVGATDIIYNFMRTLLP